MVPRTRYQGAIIRDHQVLLLKQIEHASGRSYWQIPGGRIAPVETEELCVRREMREETGLEVQNEQEEAYLASMVKGVGATALLLADGERTPLMIPMWPETIHQVVTGRSRAEEKRQ